MANTSILAGGKLLQWGKEKKNSTELKIDFPQKFSSEPVVTLTPQWVNDGVGHIETIKIIDVASFICWSGTQAENYFVHWMAIGDA